MYIFPSDKRIKAKLFYCHVEAEMEKGRKNYMKKSDQEKQQKNF